MLNDVSKSVTNTEMTSCAEISSSISANSSYGKPCLISMSAIKETVPIEEPIDIRHRMIMPYGGTLKQKKERTQGP